MTDNMLKKTIKAMAGLLTLGGTLLFTAPLSAEDDQVFDAPDQAMWHAPSQTWFVSSLGGGISLDRDGYGWVSRTDAKGKILDPFWVGKHEGMHAPSGMIVTDDFLYVCDRDGVHKVDIAAGKIVDFFPTPGGEFINDIAMDAAGNLYVSDFFGNRIYRLPAETRKAEIWLETDALQTPDGLLVDGDKLIVAAWGPLSDRATFATSKLGDLLSIDLKSKKITTLVPTLGNLEGITKAGDHYYITDWAAGKLIEVNASTKAVRVLISGLSHPTDPGFAEELGVLAFPQHGTNQVLQVNLGHP